MLVVEGGYLVGFNAGEFGGGAWWSQPMAPVGES